MEFRLPLKAAAGALLAVTGCAVQTSANNSAVCDAYNAGRSHVEIVAAGRVTRVLGIQSGRVSA